MAMARGAGAGNIDTNRFMWIFLGIVAYLIIVIVQLNLYDEQMINADSFRLLFTDRCQVEDTRFTRVYPEHPTDNGTPGSTAPILVTESACGESGLKGLIASDTNSNGIGALTPVQGATYAVGTTYHIIEEHGFRLGTFKIAVTVPLSGGSTTAAAANVPTADIALTDASDIHWEQPLKITESFNALLLIIVGILPLIATMHFLGVGAANMLSMEGTTAPAMIALVFESIITFLIIIIVIQFSPTLLVWMNDSYLLTESGRLSIFEDIWGNLTRILWVVIPLLFTIGLVGLFAVTGFRAYQRARPGIERGREYVGGMMGRGRRGRGRRGGVRRLRGGRRGSAVGP